MNCPNCGHSVAEGKKRCASCGQDVEVYARLYRLSNRYYNKGLERAKVRDLSGAVFMLKKSLELDKRNIDARNLLGLVLYEMGEAVAALSEWIISKHFQPENNDADYFMEKLQENPTRFDLVNQTIKKYNQALAAAKQGSDDLAIIQLKKVVSANPHYVRALQLLALLYLKNCENEKARRCLVKAARIDVANITTLTYLEEIKRASVSGTGQREELSTEEALKQPIAPIETYHEDKPNYMAFVTFFLGIAIGIAVLYGLVIPTVRQNIVAEYTAKERDYGGIISVHTATIASLESERDSLKKQVEELEKKASQIVDYDEEQFDELLAAAAEYPALLSQLERAEEEETVIDQLEIFTAFAEKLRNMELRFAEQEDAVKLYEGMKDAIYPVIAANCYEYGHTIYVNGDFEEALPYLETAYRYQPEDPETLYFLARTYHRLENTEQAKAIYEELLNNYPDSRRYEDAATFYKELSNN